MYNPYITAFGFLVSAFQSLICKEAQQFYVTTAIQHTITTVDVIGAAGHQAYEAGQAFRKFHDSAIVPSTLFILVGLHQFMQRLNHEEIEEYQTALPYAPKAIAALPPARQVERVLITPCITVERVLVTPAPIESVSFDHEIIEESEATIVNQPVSISDLYDGLGELQSEVVYKPEPYANYGFKQLQALCKQRGVSAKGSRDTLVSRLCGADIQPPQVEWRVLAQPSPTKFMGRSID